MKLSSYALLLALPALSLATEARAQDAGSPPPASTAPAASTPPPSSNPPPAAAAAPAAPAAASSDSGQQQTGFAFETHFYTTLLNLGTGVGSVNLPLIAGGIFGGYKLDRLIVGLGFDFTSYDAGGGAQITMAWTPGVRYEILRSSDERVALFGQADLGFGHNFGLPVANEIINVDLGIGARYWVHRQFAFSAVGGWNGNWLLTQPPSPLPSTSAVLMGIFAGVQLLGVF